MSDLEIKAKIGIDGTEFDKGLSGLAAKLAGAFSVGAAVAGLKSVLQYSDEIIQQSSRLGIGPKMFQEWSLAAKQSGIDINQLTQFVERLSDAASILENTPGFKKLGINPASTRESLLRQTQQWARGKTSSQIEEGLKDAGMSIQKIGPVVQLLKSDIDEVVEKLRKMGAIIDDKTLKALSDMNNQLQTLSSVIKANLAPVILDLAKQMVMLIGDVQAAGLWLGAMTAHITPKDIWKAFVSLLPGGFMVDNILALREDKKDRSLHIPGYGAGELVEKLLGVSKGDNNAEVRRATADTLRNNRIAEIDKALERLGSQEQGADGDKIKITSSRKAVKHGAIASDALVSVGNFLGAAGRTTLETIASDQLQEAKKTNIYLSAMLAAGIKNGDPFGMIGVP